MRRIQLAEQQIESAVIPLADDFDPMPDEKSCAHPLTGLVLPSRAEPVVDHLRTAGGADVHEKREPDVVVLGQRQHLLGGAEHSVGPVVAAFTQDPSRSVEHIESVAPVDIGRLSGRAKRIVLGAKGHDLDVGKADQSLRVSVRSSVR